MPHSNFRERPHASSSGVGKCSCGQTFDYASERDRKLKMKMHRKFCSNPSKGFNGIGVSKTRSAKKATTLKEFYNNESEQMRKLYE